MSSAAKKARIGRESGNSSVNQSVEDSVATPTPTPVQPELGDTRPKNTDTKDKSLLEALTKRTQELAEQVTSNTTNITHNRKRIAQSEVAYKKFNVRVDGLPLRTVPREDRPYWYEQLKLVGNMMGLDDNWANKVFSDEEHGGISSMVRFKTKNDTLLVVFKDVYNKNVFLKNKAQLKGQFLGDRSISLNVDKTPERMKIENQCKDKRNLMSNDPLYIDKTLHLKGVNIEVIDGAGVKTFKHFSNYPLSSDASTSG